MVTSGLSYSQFATFEPIIEEMPSTPNFNGFMNNNSAKNKACLDFVLQFQNEILDIKLKTKDAGLIDILTMYYEKLGIMKKNPEILYMFETELSEMPLKLKKELIDYVPENQSTNDTSNSDPIFEVGFNSPSYVENLWNEKNGKYEIIGKNEIESEFYLTNNTISFKKGNNDWLINKWSYDSAEKKNGIVIYKDERNQMICIDKELTVIIYFHDYDGKIYQKMTAYTNLNKNTNVKPPWINDPTFQKTK